MVIIYQRIKKQVHICSGANNVPELFFISGKTQYLGMQIPQPEFAIGTISRNDPVKGTCDVALSDERGILYDVPILGTESCNGSTSVSLSSSLEKNSVVLLMRICYEWYVACTIPIVINDGAGTATSCTSTNTGGDNSVTYGKSSSSSSYMTGRNVDVLSGDKRLVANGGSELLLGKEGLIVLKASALAQLILGAYKNFARIVAREFELFTDFGTVRFTGGGKDGVTGMAIMGGGNFADEASTIEPAYPVHMYIGDVPWDANGRFAMQVDSPDGAQHIRREIDVNGNQETYASKAIAERSLFRKTVVDDSEEHHVVGGQYVAVGMGGLPDADEQDLRDDVQSLAAGNRATDIKGNDALTVHTGNLTQAISAGDHSMQVGKNQTITVGGKQNISVAGKITESTEDNKDLKVKKTLALKLGGLTIGSYDGSTGTFTINTSNTLNIVKGQAAE